MKVLVEAMYASDSSSSASCSPKGSIPSPGTSTYLGSNLWEQTIPFDPGCKDSLDYLELETFLDENREFIDITNLIDTIEDKSGPQPQLESPSVLSTPVHVPEYHPPPATENQPTPLLDTRPEPEDQTSTSPSPPANILLYDACPLSSDDSSSDSFSSKAPEPLPSDGPAPQGEAKKRPLAVDGSDGPQPKRGSREAPSDLAKSIEGLEELSIGPPESKGGHRAKKKKKGTVEGKKTNKKRKRDNDSEDEYRPHESTKKKKNKKSSKSRSGSSELALDSKLPFLPKVDLKQQPVIKKGSKKYVPSEEKDEKYWARRQKNNMAAKRSRDARRMKENQIVMRATILEEEHSKMAEELRKANKLIESLKKRLSKYEKV